MKSRSRPNLLARHVAGSLCAMALCASVYAQVRSFDIAAGELKSALDAYAAQSGTQLIYKIEACTVR
jgi:iron complex outermembrane receptor protein